MTAESKKVLGTVPDAENLLVTTDERWFASGGDGFYQIDPHGITPPQKIPIAFDVHSSPSVDNRSFFFGITQFQNFVYSTCTPDVRSKSAPRYIMCMDLLKSPASMMAIHQISSPVFFNGLISDAVGNLYLANEGAFLPPQPGRIVKLGMSSSTTVASQSDWLEVDGHPNGLKIDGQTLYFSQEPIHLWARASVKKVDIQSDGTAGAPETIYTAGIIRLLDDIELVDGGLLVTQGGSSTRSIPRRFITAASTRSSISASPARNCIAAKSRCPRPVR